MSPSLFSSCQWTCWPTIRSWMPYLVGCHGNRGLVLLFGTTFPVEGTGYCQFDDSKRTEKECRQYSFWSMGPLCWSLVWPLLKYALYSMITIFVSSRVTDAVFYQVKRMQAMIVTSQPDAIIEKIHKNCIVEQPLSTMQKRTHNQCGKAVSKRQLLRAQSLMNSNILWKAILSFYHHFRNVFISSTLCGTELVGVKVTTIVVTFICWFSFMEKEPTISRNRKFFLRNSKALERPGNSLHEAIVGRLAVSNSMIKFSKSQSRGLELWIVGRRHGLNPM